MISRIGYTLINQPLDAPRQTFEFATLADGEVLNYDCMNHRPRDETDGLINSQASCPPGRSMSSYRVLLGLLARGSVIKSIVECTGSWACRASPKWQM